MRNWLGISGEEARGLQVTWAGHAPRATSVEGVGGADGTRNTGGADGERAGGPDGARNTGGAATKNTSDAAAMRVCERPGGESPPPDLYTGLTCR